MTIRGARISLFALASVLAGPAFAQAGETPAATPAQASRTTVYPASFFAQYAPRSALDIARQVPGFQIDFGNNNTRGFAGAAGNVVINGQRPSSKAEGIDTILSRIPATRVVRVEVGPGDLYGAEYSSKNQVLNVITSAGSGIDGNVTASGRRWWSDNLVPNVSGSVLIKRGQHSVNVAAGSERYDSFEEGTDTLTDPASGELIEWRRKLNSYFDRAPYVSAAWGFEQGENKAIHLNTRYTAGTFFLTQSNQVEPVGDIRRGDRLVQDFKNPGFELGGDITRPLAGGAIKLVGLANRRKRDNFETYLFRVDGNILGGFEQTQEAQRNETIGRLTWSRGNWGGFSVELGGEAVLNTLDSEVQFFDIAEGGERTQIDLPIDQATVKEKRAEAFVNIGHSLGKNLRLDGGLTWEFSHLTVSGDTSAERQLKFLKPSLTVDWKPGKGWHTQFIARRTVAQLDFFDFISVAELSTDRINAGNANLQPQRAWEFRATVDHPLLGDGLAKLELGYDHIQMLQDRILIFDDEGNGFDAPGNLGTGKRSFAALTLDAPLQKLGLKGTRLKFFGQLQRTRVEDSISGEQRNFSGFYPDWQWELSMRRDAGAISYGFGLSDRDRFTFFRTDEFDTNWNGGIYGTAFVEYRPNKQTTVTLDLDNALDTQAFRERLRFFPNRTNPEPGINELRERNRHLNFGLTFKRSFGGGGTSAAKPGN
jgi:hypothetical protein